MLLKEDTLAVSTPGETKRISQSGAEPRCKNVDERKGAWASLLLILLPLLCCGGPLIFAALAAASAAVLGLAGGVLGVVLIASAAGLALRHRRRNFGCCVPPKEGWRP